MNSLSGFAAIADVNARVLILGSMPGSLSLQEQRYYAHPRNSFWFIMKDLFDATELKTYTQKLQLLRDKKIALWDVLETCERKGSLDSAIQSHSVIANDFETFFGQHTQIHSVFFNGARAETEYKKHVARLSGIQSLGLQYHRLPSTSPAHAAMSREQKCAAWKSVADILRT